jgi:ElaB/YqjD/DUF883 family membrane-anchored ribosome-binding protein
MAQQSFGRESDQISKIKDKASDQFNKVAGQAEDIANRVADQGREMSESMHKVAGNFKGALDTSIREQPIATLVAAAVVGFVLGALWKS